MHNGDRFNLAHPEQDVRAILKRQRREGQLGARQSARAEQRAIGSPPAKPAVPEAGELELAARAVLPILAAQHDCMGRGPNRVPWQDCTCHLAGLIADLERAIIAEVNHRFGRLP